jgi:apolipoprotein N-acyltransferase
LFSGLLLWASFPPLSCWPLAWIAPIGWLVLVRCNRLPGRRPYAAVALACFLHWLAVFEGVRLAHPALYLGWFALAAYLAVYPVLFVVLTRIAVHRWRISILLAAPTVWTGLEWVRGHAITGFSMALLGHTQMSCTTLLQIADVFGAYGISFVVMLVAASLARMLPMPPPGEASRDLRWAWWPAAFPNSPRRFAPDRETADCASPVRLVC